jgi:FkbM family methyltransferase
MRYENWKNIIQSIKKDKDCNEVILRSGNKISAPENTSCFIGLVEDIFFNNIYTPPGFSIENNDVVVDIGAHVGTFTLFAASKTKNMVYAFEPFAINFEFLNKNIHTNKLNNISTYNNLVSDKIGIERLFLLENSREHLIFNKNENTRPYLDVSSITLKYIIDNIIGNKFKQIDFLKLNCEGAEGLILLSTPINYFLNIKKIVMEFHDTLSPLKHNEVQELLKKVGFVTELNWDGNLSSGYIYARR